MVFPAELRTSAFRWGEWLNSGAIKWNFGNIEKSGLKVDILLAHEHSRALFWRFVKSEVGSNRFAKLLKISKHAEKN